MNRRSFLTGLLAAPLVVKAEILMPIQSVIMPGPAEVFWPDEIVHWFDGRTFCVDSSVLHSGDGKTFQTAFKTISEALIDRQEGDTIVIANGTYRNEYLS